MFYVIFLFFNCLFIYLYDWCLCLIYGLFVLQWLLLVLFYWLFLILLFVWCGCVCFMFCLFILALGCFVLFSVRVYFCLLLVCFRFRWLFNVVFGLFYCVYDCFMFFICLGLCFLLFCLLWCLWLFDCYIVLKCLLIGQVLIYLWVLWVYSVCLLFEFTSIFLDLCFGLLFVLYFCLFWFGFAISWLLGLFDCALVVFLFRCLLLCLFCCVWFGYS